MPVFNVKPKFLYPHSRQFPFDEVAEKIVRELEKRNFQVPGITVDFDVYGSGELKYQRVFHVIGEEFKLTFMRIQGLLEGDFNDIAALEIISIPKQILHVYEDESGPTYYLYVGDNWEKDKDHWWYEDYNKGHAKLNKEPRRYLKYKGNGYHQRAIELVLDTDLDREYTANEGEPISFNLQEKYDEFATWLDKHVLQYILSFKEADVLKSSTKQEELIPYRGHWKQFYTMCTENMVDRISIGKNEPQRLPPEERFAYAGTGHRLVTLDVPCKNRFPEVAYEGFIWCNTTKELSREVISAMYYISHNHYLLMLITPKYANHIYVVDHSKYKKKRNDLFDAIAPRERLTNDELGDALAARGATIVPITEYQGGYAEPIVLIDRELDFDEVEVLEKIF